MLTEASTYDELTRNFRWDIPDRFNMATACCDRYAGGSGRLALIYVDEDGATTRSSFDEVAEMSRRFADVLKVDGLVRGDRVAVFLSQSLELPIAHPAVAMSAVVGIPDPVRTESIKAWIVLRPGFTPDDTLAREIQEFVKVQLAAHEYPRFVQFVESLPMTATGKVLRRELRALG
jgi:acyl-coenzyme A synthetase/AMP-(fatty) acid ligase